MVECELCLEQFPIDCFEFLSCAHKTCIFCYSKLYNISESNTISCPFCRTINNSIGNNENNENNKNNESNENNENTEYHKEYEYLENLCKKFIKVKNKNKRK